jgi:hypothetical protein
VAGLLLLGGVDSLEPQLRGRALSALPFVVVGDQNPEGFECVFRHLELLLLYCRIFTVAVPFD